MMRACCWLCWIICHEICFNPSQDEFTRLRYLTEEEIERLLAECFESIKKRQILGTEYIFCDQKGHIKDIRTAFNAALKRARILDFRPYDLWHTLASHYLMRGGSLRALQNILGHKDLKMTMRYAHLSKEFAKEEIKLLDGLTSGKKKEDGHKMVTSSLSEKAASS